MAIAVASTYLPPPDGNVPVRNASGGFLRKILFLLKKHASNSTSVLLVNEPEGASKPVQAELSELLSKSVQVTQLEDVMGSRGGAQEFDVDYCLPGCFANVNARFDAILNQAVLEHIVDPVQALKKPLQSFASWGSHCTANMYASHYIASIPCRHIALS